MVEWSLHRLEARFQRRRIPVVERSLHRLAERRRESELVRSVARRERELLVPSTVSRPQTEVSEALRSTRCLFHHAQRALVRSFVGARPSPER